ncbi:MAG: putative 2-dehydropantoate 2-reductase [Lentisphaerae bacterium]|nr:putative 2-dehydropantoate 2-reductase [Lentisphaerota bacterium]
MSRRYAIVGCGAVGGYYGACLQRAGAEVHYLLHRDYDHVRAHGLRIDSKFGNFVLPRVHAAQRPDQVPPCDVVLVGLKTTANHVLPEILPRLLAPGGVVLLLQNGLGEEDALARIPGVGTIVSGLCFLCANKVGPGHVLHLDYGAIMLGEYRADGRPAGVTPAMQAIAADFKPTGIPIELLEDLLGARWKKLVWNIPFNGLSVLLNTDTRRLMDDPGLRPVIRGLMEEVVAASAATGHAVPAGFIDKMVAQTEAMAAYLPSMKLDYDAGRLLELSSMYEAPLRQASAAGATMPLTEALWRELGFMENSKGR